MSKYEKLDLKDSLRASFSYQTGKVVLDNGTVLVIPEGYRFLNAAQGRMLVEGLWGNPRNPGFLGVLLPNAQDDDLFGVEISEDESGYLSQPEARELNYTNLMQEMQQHLLVENQWRDGKGLCTVDYMYWALPPGYHETDNTLHLPRVLQLGSTNAILNYEVRMLTRTGAFSLTAIAKTGQLNRVRSLMSALVGQVHIPIGQRYRDFNPHTDQMAAWTERVLRMGTVLDAGYFFQWLLDTWLFVAVSLMMVLFIYVMQYIHRRREPKELFRIDERLN
ncbi:DUF2167 domain-containing protein [Chitinophaga qingshengii]|uniref:DUF2167 domain-containing protein n=1 Tax=Chitinophaga qingshengii TaxID=1569794 RepID=A0ABR7TQL9_9BACT|nr:DUF2167 domain-containing protein [Chitinophaga qingshengii]MBC9931888.1 DUF2167 domain-containing protein [Chitinophaga qingshengii]